MRPYDPAIDPPWSIRSGGGLGLTSEHAAALGRVTAQWAYLEAIQQDFIGQLVRLTGPAGQAVTAELTALQRVAAIRTLIYCTQKQDWLDEWDELAGKLRDVQAKRNDAVHAQWAGRNGTFFARRTKAKGTLQTLDFEFSTTELTTLSEAIIDLTDAILGFGLRILDQERPSAWVILQNLRELPEPLPTPNPSRAARAQAEARARKKARREADRAASRKARDETDPS